MATAKTSMPSTSVNAASASSEQTIVPITMALVSYSDSEGSDVEDQQVEIVGRAPTPLREEFSFARKPTKSTAANAPSLVDRGNPRKLRVALPEIKPETEDGEEEGPARKKPKMNGDGSLLSAFNSMLPPPKRTANTQPAASSGKTFSLKTGAAPGFQRVMSSKAPARARFRGLHPGQPIQSRVRSCSMKKTTRRKATQ